MPERARDEAVCQSSSPRGEGLVGARVRGPRPRTHLRWVPQREHTVVAVVVDTRRGDKPSELLEEFEWGEDALGAAVLCGSREAMEKPSLG